jgi:hypothetical protein
VSVNARYSSGTAARSLNKGQKIKISSDLRKKCVLGTFFWAFNFGRCRWEDNIPRHESIMPYTGHPSFPAWIPKVQIHRSRLYAYYVMNITGPSRSEKSPVLITTWLCFGRNILGAVKDKLISAREGESQADPIPSSKLKVTILYRSNFSVKRISCRISNLIPSSTHGSVCSVHLGALSEPLDDY